MIAPISISFLFFFVLYKEVDSTDIGYNNNQSKHYQSSHSEHSFQIMWFALSHFSPNGVRHHKRKMAHGTPIANNITPYTIHFISSKSLIPPFEHSISPNEIIQMPGLIQTKTFLMAYFRRFIHVRIFKIELHETAGIPHIDI
jgi:hypothetical protein